MIKRISRNVRFGIGLAAAVLVANTTLVAVSEPEPVAEGLSFCGTEAQPCRLDPMVVAVEPTPAAHRAPRPVLAEAPAPHKVMVIRRHADS